MKSIRKPLAVQTAGAEAPAAVPARLGNTCHARGTQRGPGPGAVALNGGGRGVQLSFLALTRGMHGVGAPQQNRATTLSV